MPPDCTPTCWPTDLTRVCERVATRLAADGARHPVAAAVLLAARGHAGLDQAAFARRHQLPLPAVQRAEAGELAWEDLPDIIGDLLARIESIDLLALADMNAQFSPGPGEATG